MCAMARVRASTHTQVSLHMQFITRVKKQSFHFVLSLLYISCKEKFFIEIFFVEDYIQNLQRNEL